MFTPAVAATTPQISVCEVMQRPSLYRGHIVHIHAGILLALPHGAIIVDKACPKTAILLGSDLPKAESSATDLIQSILNDCTAGAHLHAVEGIFTGKLAYSADGRINLRLASVSELHVQSCSEPEPVVLPDKGDDGKLPRIFQPH